MNKILKISLSFITIGFILLAIATLLNKGNIPGINPKYEKKNYTISAQNIENIKLDLITDNVVIEENKNSNEVEIEYYDNNDKETTINNSENTLSIKESKKVFGIDIDINFFSTTKEVKIKIPKDTHLNFNIVAKLGDVNINDLNIKDLTINNKMGNVNLTNITTNNVSMKLDGDFTLNNVKGNNSLFTIKTNIGTVKFDKVEGFNDLDITNQTGDISVSSSIIKDIKINNQTGNVLLSNSPKNSTDNINIKNETGDVKLDELTVNNSIYLESKYGNIEANIADKEKNYIRNSNSDTKKSLITISRDGNVNVNFLEK